MPWIEALLRGQRVLARAGEDRRLVAEGGRVEIRYKPTDGRAYRAAEGNLVVAPDARVFPDDHCAPAEPAGGGNAKGGGAGGGSKAKTEAAKKAAAAARFAESSAAAHAHASKTGQGVWVVYTDGACSGNPGPAGCGFLVVDPGTGEVREGFEYLGEATNNVAELTAILRGVEGVNDVAAHVRVHTDSLYAIGVLQKGWKAKANPALVARIKSELSRRPNAVLVYVPGHAGVALNERVDELAREAVQTRSSRLLP